MQIKFTKYNANFSNRFPRFILGLIISFLLFLLFQTYAGFIGIQHHLGSFFAFICLLLAIFFRFTLPITIGSFFGAMNVWGWNPIFALLFAAPSFMLIIPGFLTTLFFRLRNEKIVGVNFSKKYDENDGSKDKRY